MRLEGWRDGVLVTVVEKQDMPAVFMSRRVVLEEINTVVLAGGHVLIKSVPEVNQCA